MANRTDPHAGTVHGTNPQYLVDKIIRVKVYNDAYWKEHCFALTAETLIDRAAKLDYVGGTYGGRRRPAKFLCLVLKMLQLQPDEDVVLEYIKQPELKYLRALGALYLRVTARPVTTFRTLEPLFADYRKLRYRDLTGKLSIIHMDEFVDWLLREETVCDVTMTVLPRREALEETHNLEPRRSVLEDDLEEDLDIEELEQAVNRASAVEAVLVNPSNGGGGVADAPASVGCENTNSRNAAEKRRGRSASGRPSASRSAPGSPPPRRRSERKRASSSSASRSPRGEHERKRLRSSSPGGEHSSSSSYSSSPSRSPSAVRDSRDTRGRTRTERKGETDGQVLAKKSAKQVRLDHGKDSGSREKSHTTEDRKADVPQKRSREAEPEIPTRPRERPESHAPVAEPREVPVVSASEVLQDLPSADLDQAETTLKNKKVKKEKTCKLWRGQKASGIEKKTHHSASGAHKDDMSVEQWNDVRKGLGLKPLKG